MPISKEQLREKLSNARNIIDRTDIPKFGNEQPNLQEINSPQVSYVERNTELDYRTNYSGFDDDKLIGAGSVNTARNQEIQYNRASARSSRMPGAIKESMLNDRIDTSSLNPNRSVVDELGMPTQNRQKRIVTEQKTVEPVIDYEAIEEMINDAIEKAISNSTLKAIHISNGKIRLVDNSGNIFSAKLELKGNINDKKK